VGVSGRLPRVHSIVEAWPLPISVALFVCLIVAGALAGLWRASRGDERSDARRDNIGAATLSLAIAGFTLVGSFAAYSLWSAESTRSALLGMELASARAMLTEAQNPGTTDPEPLRHALLNYATALRQIYQKGEVASADSHGYDTMLELSRSLRISLPTNPSTASQMALESDYEALVKAHNERTSQTRPLLPSSVFYALLIMATVASYVAGRFPIGQSRELKATQVVAAVLVISSLLSVVLILDASTTSASRSLPALEAFIDYLQSLG